MSANQLAAQGIQLSVKEDLIKFIQGMSKDKITTEEKKLLNVLQNSQENKDDEPNQIVSSKPESEEKQISSVNNTMQPSVHSEEEDEETNLVFFDPAAEARKEKEMKFLEDQRNRQNLLKDSTGANAAI